MTVFTPRPWQPPMVKHIVNKPRCHVFSGCGTGKTAATLEALSVLLQFGQSQRVLVVAPKRVARDTWPEAVEKFGSSFGWMTVAVAIGTESQRHAAIDKGAHITTINYDNLSWLIEHYGATWPWDTVVCDEATKLRGLRVSIQTHKKSGKKYLAGQGASRAKALARVAHTKVKRFINLTGTPTLAGLEALWGPTWFLDAGYRLGASFSAFTARWFRAMPGSTPQQPKIEPMPFSEAQIRSAIQDITLVVDLKDYVDVGTHQEHIVGVTLPPAAKKQYDQMAKELATEINNKLVEAMTAGAMSQKLLQIASGAAYVGDQGDWELVHDEKIEALKSLEEEALGMPLLVFYHFKSDAARILKAFPKAKHLDDNPATMERWKRGEIPMLLAHPASAGHGVDGLQYGTSKCVFFSTNWSAENDAQAIERIGPTRQMQAGFDRVVDVYRIVAKGTVEESAVKRLHSRVSVQEALLEGLKQYQTNQSTFAK